MSYFIKKCFVERINKHLDKFFDAQPMFKKHTLESEQW